jgi:hypothetical protein
MGAFGQTTRRRDVLVNELSHKLDHFLIFSLFHSNENQANSLSLRQTVIFFGMHVDLFEDLSIWILKNPA